MNSVATLISIGLLAGSVLSAAGQGFINLNFENASVTPPPPSGIVGYLQWDQAAPGWNHSTGSDTSGVYYGLTHVGISQWYLLLDTLNANGSGSLSGRFSLAFASGQADSNNVNSPWVNAFISQTGTIGADIKSLRLLATGPFSVQVGDVSIPMVSLGGNSYAGDISAFAGSASELKIVNDATAFGTAVVVDNVVFSTSYVPEPSVAALLLLAFLGRRWIGVSRAT